MSRELTSRQTAAIELHGQGLTFTEIARRLGITRMAARFRVVAAEQKRTGVYHGKRIGEYLNESIRSLTETPAEARERITREIAEGKRCGHLGVFGRPCSLTLPCADHETEVTP